jgi:predicted lipoprotein with Yx(FWY)xxD motif
MPMNEPTAARPAVTGRWLVATAAALRLLALLTFLLLRPAAGNASPTAARTSVSTASTKLGRVLVNSRGRTLYLFGKDKNAKSACNGTCAAFWPPLIASGKPRATAGAKASLLGTTKRADRRLQVTYNHHPLYTFAKDTKKGQTNGEGERPSRSQLGSRGDVGRMRKRESPKAFSYPSNGCRFEGRGKSAEYERG